MATAAKNITKGDGDASTVVQIPVPQSVDIDSEDASTPTTLQLVLTAREQAMAMEAAEKAAAAVAAPGSAVPSPRKPNDAPFKLPHLREPTKEPDPSDPDFPIRLGAFMARSGETSFLRLLQKEFPEPDTMPQRLAATTERPRTRHISTPNSSLSPGLSPRSAPISPALSPVAVHRGEFKWGGDGGGGGIFVGRKHSGGVAPGMGAVTGVGAQPRRASLTLRRRRESSQLQKGPDYLAPLPGSYITESESSYARFQRVARLVKVVAKVCRALKGVVERNDSGGWSFTEMYLHVQQDMRQDLAFNRHNFTKAQPLNGGPRLEKLLSIPPAERTAYHVQMILSILRAHPGFNDFPDHVQIKFCRVMQYELYEARRLLLRQGHQPTAFYMLLTGTLMVNIKDVHPSSGHVFIRTVADLREGDCFGELSLLEECPRTATIICKTNVELLSVPKEDFDRIVRTPLLQQREQNIMLCHPEMSMASGASSMALRSSRRTHWNGPQAVLGVKGLNMSANGVVKQALEAGMVVVKNGQICAYFVFVKSGKCRLVSSYSSNEITRKRLESASREMQRAFPLYTEVMKIARSRRRPMTHPEPRLTTKDRQEVDMLTRILDKQQFKSVSSAKRELGVRLQERPVPPARPPLQKSRTLSNFYEKLEKERRQKLMGEEEPGKEVDEQFWGCRLQGPALQKPTRPPKSGRRPVTGQNSRRLDFLRPDVEGFAQIAELNAGDVFGLETMIKKQPARVSVVSEGAELIFVSKKLFLQEANIRVLRVVNDMGINYPSAVDIHDDLKYEKDWTRYKRALVRHVVNRIGREYQPPSCETKA